MQDSWYDLQKGHDPQVENHHLRTCCSAPWCLFPLLIVKSIPWMPGGSVIMIAPCPPEVSCSDVVSISWGPTDFPTPTLNFPHVPLSLWTRGWLWMGWCDRSWKPNLTTQLPGLFWGSTTGYSQPSVTCQWEPQVQRIHFFGREVGACSFTANLSSLRPQWSNPQLRTHSFCTSWPEWLKAN